MATWRRGHLLAARHNPRDRLLRCTSRGPKEEERTSEFLARRASSIPVGFLLTAPPLLTRARRPGGSAVSYLSIKPSGLCQQKNFPPGALAVCTAQRPGGAPTVGLTIAYRIGHPGTAKMRSQRPSRSPLAKCEMQGLHCYPPNIFL